MTAGTDVCEISKTEIENKCDVVGVDCNGSTKLTDANVNGDSDSSYDFIDEVVTLDPVETSINVVADNCKSCLKTNDVEIQVEENGGGVDCCLVESDCIVVGKSNEGEIVDGVDRSHDVAKEEVNESAVMEVVEPDSVISQAADDEVVEFDSGHKAVKSDEFRVAVNEVIESVVDSSVVESGFEVSEPAVESFEAASVVEEAAIEPFETVTVVEALEVGEPVVEASGTSSFVEVQEIRETVVESVEAFPVVEMQEVGEPVGEPSEISSVVEVQEVSEPVVESVEAFPVVEMQEVGEPVGEPSEISSVVEVQEVSEPVVESVEAFPVVEMQEVGEPVVEPSEISSVTEVQEVSEPVVESVEAFPVVEMQEVGEPVVEPSETSSVVEVQEVREPVVESVEAASVVEAQEVKEPLVEASEADSVVEVQEVRESIVEAYEAESVVETLEVRKPATETFEVGGAMAVPVAESNLELVESQASDKNVVLEADGSELPEVNDVGETKSEGLHEFISNGQVEASEDCHLASRSIVEYEKKLEKENKTETDNQESPVLFTSEIQSGLIPENETADIAIHGKSTLETEVAGSSALNDNQASGTEHIARSIEQNQMETQPSKDFEDDQVLFSADHVRPESEEPLKAETIVDHAFNEDLVSKPENVSELALENQKFPQLNVDHEDSQVLSSADLLISETETEKEVVPLEVETVSDPATHEIKDSEAEVVSECINESPNDIQLNECPQDAQILPSMECVGSDTKNESEVPLETDSGNDPTPSENQASQIEEGSKCIDESQKDTYLNKDPEVAQSLPTAICVRSETVNGTEVPSETKTYSKVVLNEKAQVFPSSHCVISQSENGNVAVENGGNFCSGPNDSRLLDNEVGNGDSLITENVLTPSIDYSSHGAEIESQDDKNSKDGLCCAPNHSKSDIEVQNGAGGGDSVSALPKKLVCPESSIEFGSIGPRQNAPKLWCDDAELDVPNGDADPTNGSSPGYHANGSHQSESLPGLKSEFKAKHSSSISSSDLPSNCVVNATSHILAGSVGGMETVLNPSEKVEDDVSGDGISFDKAACLENVIIDGVQDGMPTTLPESSISDATDGQNADAEVITMPFRHLIKIPRYEGDKLMEKIRHAQLQVDEKTQQRDAIRAEIRNIRTNCQAHGERFEAAKAEERTARRSVKSKRQEIDSLQSVINRVKNAISVEEIDKRIYGMEHMIQHETLPLKEEKEFIREIKRLKHLREQLSSNMGSQDEVQLALDQKDQNEEHLKKLKKELETLKDTVLKAEAVKFSAGKKYDEESKRLRELQAQFKAANDIRQEAYEHLSKLRGQLNEKHKNFRVYKDDAAAAIGYASRGDKEALYRLCAEQVNQVMGLWNTDDEFRKEYVRCNMRSTVRRLRTLDGRSLNPDEEPPVLPAYVDERVGRRLISVPNQAKSVTAVVAYVEQNKQVSSAEEKQAGQKSIEQVAELKIPTVKTPGTAKAVVPSGSATVSGRDVKVEEDRKEEEEEKIKSEKELELARKAEELRKAEDAAKLKEQRRLEEKAKAKEALERKKKIAEKAEMRAKLRAQKEAEEKEKEKEKRMRKKEKKKWGTGDDNEEDAATSGITVVAKELSEVKESNNSTGGITKKAPPKGWFGKQSSKPKPIPPTVRNRNRKRMQQYMWMSCIAIFILALFLLGNTGFFLNFKHRKGAGNF